MNELHARRLQQSGDNNVQSRHLLDVILSLVRPGLDDKNRVSGASETSAVDEMAMSTLGGQPRILVFLLTQVCLHQDRNQ